MKTVIEQFPHSAYAPMSNPSKRRYDVDWLRVIAITILLVFHIMVMFQSYANQIRFIQSPVLLEVLLIVTGRIKVGQGGSG